MPADKDEIENEEVPKALDEDDIALLKTYVIKKFPEKIELIKRKGLGPYTASIKTIEEDIKKISKKVNEMCGMLLKGYSEL
jgi:hypothetical protein